MMAKPIAIRTPVVMLLVLPLGSGGIIGSAQTPSKPRRSGVSLAREEVGGQRRNAVQEEQPVEVIDLVLQRARFEGVGGDLLWASVRRRAANGDDLRAPHVAREVGEAHAALARDVGAASGDDLRVDQDDETAAR